MWSSGRQKPKGRPVGPEHGTPMEATGRPGPDRRPAPGAASTQTEEGNYGGPPGRAPVPDDAARPTGAEVSAH